MRPLAQAAVTPVKAQQPRPQSAATTPANPPPMQPYDRGRWGPLTHPVFDKVRQRAKARGVDPEMMVAMLRLENGGTLNPRQMNTSGSGAAGHYQFEPNTWRAMGGGNVFDEDLNIDRAMTLAQDNTKSFQIYMKRDPAPWELYLLHQQGAGRTARLLRKPGDSAAAILGSKEAVVQNGGNENMTASEFTQFIRRKYETAAAVTNAGRMMDAVPPLFRR